MKKIKILYIILPIFASVLLLPHLVNAQGLDFLPLVPECPQGQGVPGDADYRAPGCGWTELMILAQNIMGFLIAISIPLASIAFAWAGFLYITARGNQSTLERAKSIFSKVGIGFILVLTAWLIVWLITSSLLEKEYILLEP